MNETEKQKLKEFFNKVHKFLEEKADNLYYFKARWADEKEYEDFEDYKKAIINLAKLSGLTPYKITKSFNIYFKFNKNYSVVIHLKANGEAFTQIENN